MPGSWFRLAAEGERNYLGDKLQTAIISSRGPTPSWPGGAARLRLHSPAADSDLLPAQSPPADPYSTR